MHRVCSLCWVALLQKFLSENRDKRTKKQNQKKNLDMEKIPQTDATQFKLSQSFGHDGAKEMFPPTVIKHLNLISFPQIFLKHI